MRHPPLAGRAGEHSPVIWAPVLLQPGGSTFLLYKLSGLSNERRLCTIAKHAECHANQHLPVLDQYNVEVYINAGYFGIPLSININYIENRTPLSSPLVLKLEYRSL